MSTPETKKTVTILDKANKTLSKTLLDVMKVTGELAVMVDTSEEISTNIEMKSAELAGIDADIQLKLRDAKADMAIDIKEHKESILIDLMSSSGLARISLDDLCCLRDSVETLTADNNESISLAVKAAERSLHATHAVKTVQDNSAHAVESAELKSQNAALKDRISFLSDSNDTLQTMINEDRNARVQMAQNAPQPNITVQSGK